MEGIICGIYCISSNIDSRCYIGQSINIDQRFKNHIFTLNSNKHANSHLQSFFNKYGYESLSFTVIEICEKPELNEAEIYWVNKFNSCDNGFNMTYGGDKNPMDIAENRLKVSIALSGHKKSKEWIAKLVANRDKEKSFKTLVKNNRLKYIYSYNIETFELVDEGYCILKMAQKLSINESNIRQILSGKMKTCKGYHFSILKLSKDEVKNNIKSSIGSPEHRLKASIASSGINNSMYGKKRPDLSGDNNPYRKMLAAGYKRPLTYIQSNTEYILDLYNRGLKQKEIADILGCSQVSISSLLMKNGIHNRSKYYYNEYKY